MTEPAQRRRAPQDDRSIMAIAMQWSSTVITISIEMVVPGLLGYWADGHLGTGFLLLTVGMVFGVTFGIWQLIRLTQFDARKPSPGKRSSDSPPGPH